LLSAENSALSENAAAVHNRLDRGVIMGYFIRRLPAIAMQTLK
jgi:hypothetical protein